HQGHRARRGQEPRSRSKNDCDIAFHSFYTSVEIVEGVLFVSNHDYSYPSWTRTRDSKRLGQVPGARQGQGEHHPLHDLLPAHQVEPRRGRDPPYSDSERGFPTGFDTHL